MTFAKEMSVRYCLDGSRSWRFKKCIYSNRSNRDKFINITGEKI